jgi:hypothetical protein
VNLDLRKLFQLMPILQVEKTEPPEESPPPVPEEPKIQENQLIPETKKSQDSPNNKDVQGIPNNKESSGAPTGQPDPTVKDMPPDENPPAFEDGQDNQDAPVNQDPEDNDAGHDQKKPLTKGNQPVYLQERQSWAIQIPSKSMAMLWDFLFAPVYAGEPINRNDILQWKVPENGTDQYVRKVIGVLDGASRTLLNKGELPASLEGMFRSLITAMAWQESCFRQFVEKNNQMTYLLSYNNTSVGMMQVNERVWRGLYDRDRLRWDIYYNATAGSEIAALYLQKYALRDKNNAKKMDPATLARLVYAMYNGGPGQYQDFLERSKKGKMLNTDELFWEKYSWVTSGNWEKCSQCLN